jgi:hypothetical protein
MRSHSSRLLLLGGAVLAAGIGGSLALRAQAAAPQGRQQLTAGFQAGALDHKAIGSLAFSPSGVLFFADDQGSAIYGVDLAEKPSAAAPYTRVPDLGATLAARMGTTPAGIQIKDVAVSPVSHAVYVSVRKTDGADQNPANPANYALFAVDPAGKVSPVDLASRKWGKAAVTAKVGYGQRENSPRVISDIAYTEAGGRPRVLVAALSTEQFNSNLISVLVPLKADSVERYATSIYHVSHKKQETASPIQTLTIYRDGPKEYLMAAYVCTPVVRFNLEDLKPGEVATGITVAELGSGNRPMDMIAYGKPEAQSLLLNNSSFGILKVDGKIAREKTAVNQMTTADRGNRGGTSIPGIEPIEALKGAKAYVAGGDTLLVIKPSDGGMALEPMPLP